MRLAILFNPAARRGQARRALQEALDVLERGGAQVDVAESHSAEHLVELARRARQERPHAVVAAGGDGTVHYVLNGIAEGDIPLAVIPLGRGNDFATGLGIPRQPRAAAQAILSARSRQFDLARVGPTVYGCGAGAGFVSTVNRYANDHLHALRGPWAYTGSILRCWLGYRPQPLELTSQARNFSGNVLLAAVGNTLSQGGGVKLTPRARLDDGLLDVCIVPDLPKLEVLRWVPRAYRGEHLAHPRIIYFQSPRVTLNSPHRLELFADGEFIQELPATIEAVRDAVRVIVPEDAPAGGKGFLDRQAQ